MFKPIKHHSAIGFRHHSMQDLFLIKMCIFVYQNVVYAINRHNCRKAFLKYFAGSTQHLRLPGYQSTARSLRAKAKTVLTHFILRSTYMT